MLSKVRTVNTEGNIFSVNNVFVFPWRRPLESMFSRFINQGKLITIIHGY